MKAFRASIALLFAGLLRGVCSPAPYSRASSEYLSESLQRFRSVLNRTIDDVVDASLERIDKALYQGTPCPMYRKVLPKLLDSQGKVEVVVIGGSVTRGSPQEYVGTKKRWSARLRQYLDEVWGEGKFVVKNIAEAAVTIDHFVHHVHLLSGADILFIDTSINDGKISHNHLYHAHKALISLLSLTDPNPPVIYELGASVIELRKSQQDGEVHAEIVDRPDEALMPLVQEYGITYENFIQLERDSMHRLPKGQRTAFWNTTVDPAGHEHPDAKMHALFAKVAGYGIFKDLLSVNHGVCDEVADDRAGDDANEGEGVGGRDSDGDWDRERSSSEEDNGRPSQYYIPPAELQATVAPFARMHCSQGPIIDYRCKMRAVPFPANTGTYLRFEAARNGLTSLFEPSIDPSIPEVLFMPGVEYNYSHILNPNDAEYSGLESMERRVGMRGAERRAMIDILLHAGSPLLGFAQVNSPHAAWRYFADSKYIKYGWILEVDQPMLDKVCGPGGARWCDLAEDLFTLSFEVQFGEKPLLKLFRVVSYTEVFNVSAKVWLDTDIANARSVSGFHEERNSQSYPAIFTPHSRQRGQEEQDEEEALRGFEMYDFPAMRPGGTATVQITLDGSSLTHDPPYKFKLDGVISC